MAWPPEQVIGLFPSWYAAPQPDWPSQLRLAGFSHFDGTQAGLPDAIETFCREGTPPIAFTLGTGMAHAGEFFRAAVTASKALGMRGILLTKFPVPMPLPLTVRHCTFAPFRKLFPLCRAVVHHGGIGTSAAALQSACPQLVLPLAWDQPDNADRLTALGVALTLGARRRSEQCLCDALTQLMTSAFTNRCRQIANQAVAPDGLVLAADWIEEFAKGLPNSRHLPNKRAGCPNRGSAKENPPEGGVC